MNGLEHEKGENRDKNFRRSGTLKVSDIANCKKWWNGPEFLAKDESEWPVNHVNIDQETKSMEIKRNDQKFPKKAK